MRYKIRKCNKIKLWCQIIRHNTSQIKLCEDRTFVNGCRIKYLKGTHFIICKRIKFFINRRFKQTSTVECGTCDAKCWTFAIKVKPIHQIKFVKCRKVQRNKDTQNGEFSTVNIQVFVDSASFALHRPANTDSREVVVTLAHTSLDKKANVASRDFFECSPHVYNESFPQDSGKCELVVGNVEVSNDNLTNESGIIFKKKCLKGLVEDIAEIVDDDISNRTTFEIEVKEIKSESDNRNNDFVSSKKNKTIRTRSNEPMLKIISRLPCLYQHVFRRLDEALCYAIREYYFSNNIYPVVDGYDGEEFRAILEYVLATFGRRGVVLVSEFLNRTIEYISRRRNRGVIPLYNIQDLPMPALLYCDRALHIQAFVDWLDLRPQQLYEIGDQNIVSLHPSQETTDPFNRNYRHQQEPNAQHTRYTNTNTANSEIENGNGENNSVSAVLPSAADPLQENHSPSETHATESLVTITCIKQPESEPICACAQMETGSENVEEHSAVLTVLPFAIESQQENHSSTYQIADTEPMLQTCIKLPESEPTLTVLQPVTESLQENHKFTNLREDIEAHAIEIHTTEKRAIETHLNLPESFQICECVLGAASSCFCNSPSSNGPHLGTTNTNLSNPENELVCNLEPYNTSGVPKHRDYLNETLRIMTFTNAPHIIKWKKLQMSQAGFFYTGPDDKVICYHCGGCLTKWQADDVPLHEHRCHFADCRFVQTIKDKEEALLVCGICKQNDINVVFLPCCHKICCDDCSNDILYCETCNAFITEKVVQ